MKAMADLPRVSVVMAVYNGEKYLREAMDSILAQTFRDFEFIIIDDGSTDDTARIIASFRDERIVALSQPNLGLPHALNRGIQHARGQYIARQDADDISLPQRLSIQVEFLTQHPQIALLGTNSINIDPDGNVLERRSFIATDDLQLKWLLLVSNPFVHPSVMMRRDSFEAVGCYTESTDYLHVEDYELWSRISRHYAVANLAEPLVMYRQSPFGVSAQGGDIPLRGALRISADNIGLLGEICHLDGDEHLNVLFLYALPMRLTYGQVIGAVANAEKLFAVFCRTHSISPQNRTRLRAQNRTHLAALILRAATGHSYAEDYQLSRRLAKKALETHSRSVLGNKSFWPLALKLALGPSVINQFRRHNFSSFLGRQRNS